MSKPFYTIEIKPENLDDLLSLMKMRDDSAWKAAGLPFAHGEQDWTSLPTFGGEFIDDATGIWSWDSERLIAGLCPDDIRIYFRKEWGEE